MAAAGTPRTKYPKPKIPPLPHRATMNAMAPHAALDSSVVRRTRPDRPIIAVRHKAMINPITVAAGEISYEKLAIM